MALAVLATILAVVLDGGGRRATPKVALPGPASVAPPTPATTTLPPTTSATSSPAAGPRPAPAAAGRAVPVSCPSTTADPPVVASSILATPVVAGVSYSDRPAGSRVGQLPAQTWYGATVRPVAGEQAGWFQVRLDTRPNGSTGWVRKEDVTLTTSSFEIVVSICRRNLTLYQNGQPIYSSPVGVGRPQSPTPMGLTFVDGLVASRSQELGTYGPLIMLTAAHSNVYTDFDGGDGTVAIHGYPSDPASTRGVASSHGCVRASPQTMTVLHQVPLGSPINIIR